ncbi:MAG: hypothetical protein OXH00_05280 [Candidatus Poribacteria bacterium]|nr:hypothetical protein [Candidatus Poribacteria bacterium]
MKRSYFHFLCCVNFALFCFSVCQVSAQVPTRPKIIFNSNRDGNAEIYMMDTDGRQVVRLTQHPDADFQPAWSPTGKQILFVSKRDGVHDLYLMDSNGENVRKIFKKGSFRQQPAWSPDGKQIAYLGNKGNDWAIYIATLDGKEERLSWCGRTGGFPAWSPDGTEIVFATAHAIGQAPSPMAIYNLRTGEKEIFHPEQQLRMFYPSWASDGTIVFSHVERLGAGGPVEGTLYAVNRDGGGLREIVPEKEPIAEQAVWAPSRNELAYHKKVGENRQIFTIDLASRQSQQLTSRGINVYPDWFDPAFALPVSPKPQLLTTVWAKVKITN